MANKKLQCNQCGGKMRIDSGGVTMIGGGAGPAPIVKLRCDKCDITRFEQRSDIERELAEAGETVGKKSHSTAMTQDQILQEVQGVLVDALGVDEDEVTPEATLMGDLGAESIDFLDIVFRLEKAFGIKIAREELFPAETLMNNPEFVSNGKLTAKGVAELKAKMPHTDVSEFAKNPELSKLPDLFTVGMIVNYVESKLKAA